MQLQRRTARLEYKIAIFHSTLFSLFHLQKQNPLICMNFWWNRSYNSIIIQSSEFPDAIIPRQCTRLMRERVILIRFWFSPTEMSSKYRWYRIWSMPPTKIWNKWDSPDRKSVDCGNSLRNIIRTDTWARSSDSYRIQRRKMISRWVLSFQFSNFGFNFNFASVFCRHCTQQHRRRRWRQRIRQVNYQITNTLSRPIRYVWTKSWESANSVSFNKEFGRMARNE